MSIVTAAEVRDVVTLCFEAAYRMAHNVIRFSEGRTKIAKSLMLANMPNYKKMGSGFGYAGSGTILWVDLRGSTDRALRIGARNTFITMQTYIPTMGFLVEKTGGQIVSLRGDGLIASFGFKEKPACPNEVEQEQAVVAAACCGKAMIEAIENHINPILESNYIEADLYIGVGIDIGDLVVTRIGWKDAEEVTAYGDCVNRACKVRPFNEVVISEDVFDVYPCSEDGQVGFEEEDDGKGYRLVFPRRMQMIEG